jgi:4-hydroxy-2-oxoheptanedioate aldolase
MTGRAAARRYIDAGAAFVAVGVDTSLLVRAATELRQAFKDTAGAMPGGGGSAY